MKIFTFISKSFCMRICILISFVLFTLSVSASYNGPREHIKMDFGWRFANGNSFDASKDFNNGTGYFSYYTKAGYGDGPADICFEDRTWRLINLPHDWNIELPFDSTGSHSHGYRTIGRNFPERSIGWYRKTFTIPSEDLGKRISIEFDGVHRDSKVWVNGFYLGENHSGYNSFAYDITDYLNYGGENVIAVRVDATMEEGWYYEGAGIYRHVWLTKTSPLHVDRYGTFVTTTTGKNSADITIRTTVKNEYNRSVDFQVQQSIEDETGKIIAGNNSGNVGIKAGSETTLYCGINLNNPRLWSLESPYLHKLVTTIVCNDTVADRYETIFGIRSVRFDADSGFFLNGRHVILKGTNNHQDHAGVGVAIPDALQEFRIKRLKEMGSNAYRCSHNPPAPEFLDACDRLGMLVIDENRLMGINEEHLDMLGDMMKRDRNHPSVILWSLGNEEWSIEGNIKGARITTTMQNYAHKVDSTRAFTAAVSGGWDNGTGMVLQVMGYNYIVQGDIDVHHSKFPWQAGVGTEETNTMGTRGVYVTDMSGGHMAPTNRMPENVGTESGWKFYSARPFLAGLFYWTGFDHQGEPNPCVWPAVGAQKGLVDQCGFPKDTYYYLKSWWGNEPVVHIMPHWNWPGDEGKEKSVTVYSNCNVVELFLNNRSLGKQTMEQNGHLEWKVKYSPGVLMARGFINGKNIVSDRVETSGEATVIRLRPDRSSIKADRQDVSMITVAIEDDKGRFVPVAGNEIMFTLDGPGKIIGVGNGDPSSHEADQFVESVVLSEIKNLKIMTVNNTLSRPETAADFDDSKWSQAFPGNKWDISVSTPSVKGIVIRGEFVLPDISNATEIALYARSLGEEQSLYINGHLLAAGMKRDRISHEFILDSTIVHEGKNVFSIVGTPLLKQSEWDELNTYPGSVKVVFPAPRWKRKVFNGLAQVIVQSTGKPGAITMKAESQGLKPAVVVIMSDIINEEER
jgi:beta-galactosidase